MAMCSQRRYQRMDTSLSENCGEERHPKTRCDCSSKCLNSEDFWPGSLAENWMDRCCGRC